MEALKKLLILEVLALFSLKNAICIVENLNSDPSTLELVHILFRHGDRTPVEPYPNDPYKNLSYWPVGWGQLTNEGKRQHYHLGQFLRHRYNDFISPQYLKEEVRIRSTDVDRTLMSAEANLAGLYPPSAGQVWDPRINWQPIPIHTLPESLDEVLAAKKPCLRYDEEFKKVKQSPEMKKMNQMNQELYEYLTEKSGKHIHDATSVEYLYNTLAIEERFNFTLPDWTSSVYPDKMRGLAALSFSLAAYNKELQRLKMGPLIGEILSHFTKKAEGTLMPPERKLFVYSAHDTTVANFLMTLGAFDPPFSPPYTAMILLELHQSANGDHYVSFLYKNGTHDTDVSPLTVPGCLEKCPLDRFAELMHPIIPSDWKSECHHTFDDAADSFNSFGRLPLSDLVFIAIITSGTTALLLAIAIIAMLVYWCRRRESSYWYYKLNTEGP